MAKAEPKALSTIGIRVGYCIETTAGTRPETGYTELLGITSTPDFSVSPNTADVTPLSETKSVRKIDLLQDLGDTLDFGILANDIYTDAWDKAAEEAEKATDGKQCWFVVYHPSKAKAQFFKATPIAFAFGETSVNSAWENTVHAIPQGGNELFKATSTIFTEDED